MWQEIIVGVCLIAAIIFLLRRWLFSGKPSACGGCNSCDLPKAKGNCSTPKP
ncbi:FeoB-associated Cys-rich membrane protein [Cellvibrio japonicus]|nr:FeoB-associated Cys-rich membrane protein [Cellvibrio japonicus]QEI15331.1 FeoB-associated Cys-rich membrane protein [Cellvibrio japonicus]QEI18911.1 FeoB-associated Cys-rich membrane protein [Cellvibrio japonicus]